MDEDRNRDVRFVTLAYFSNAAEAGMACELLLNNGIGATLRGANFGALDPLPMVGGFSEIQLIVPAGDLERSQDIYDAFFKSEESSLPENEDVNDGECER
jgi:hypothetical protein